MPTTRKKACSIDGCDLPAVGRGWCSKHYNRHKKHGDPLFVKRRVAGRGELQDFYRDVVIPYDGNDCLIWPFARDKAGYGRITIGGRSKNVSRLVCEDRDGPAGSTDIFAAHSCGNGHLGCVAPKHLSWKTHIENVLDMVAHGTVRTGTKNSNAKITESDVVAIRRMRGTVPVEDIARDFGICASNVRRIQSGEAWRHVPL